MVDKFLAALGKKVCEVISFEVQPEPFDGVEVRPLSREELRFKIMPVETFGQTVEGLAMHEIGNLGQNVAVGIHASACLLQFQNSNASHREFCSH